MAVRQKPGGKAKADASKTWQVVEVREIDAYTVQLIEENGLGERRPVKGCTREYDPQLIEQLDAAKARRLAQRDAAMFRAEQKVERWRAKYRLMGREMTNEDLMREHKREFGLFGQRFGEVPAEKKPAPRKKRAPVVEEEGPLVRLDGGA